MSKCPYCSVPCGNQWCAWSGNKAPEDKVFQDFKEWYDPKAEGLWEEMNGDEIAFEVWKAANHKYRGKNE